MIRVDEEFLKEILEKSSRALVGKIMKRFEISGNEDAVLKKNIKELIYEQFRDLRTHIESHSKGIELVSVYFEEKEVSDGEQE